MATHEQLVNTWAEATEANANACEDWRAMAGDTWMTVGPGAGSSARISRSS